MMSHSEKLARAALEKWLEVYTKQIRCDQCIAPNQARCVKHGGELQRLIKQTRIVLAGGPN